eukprot:572870-Pleurochrysis_carterae.AAC.1
MMHESTVGPRARANSLECDIFALETSPSSNKASQKNSLRAGIKCTLHSSEELREGVAYLQ